MNEVERRKALYAAMEQTNPTKCLVTTTRTLFLLSACLHHYLSLQNIHVYIERGLPSIV